MTWLFHALAAERVLRRLAPVLAWTALASLLLAPFACAFLLGRATAP